ncbi:uncharacterized protein LOC143150080 isoform X2 [Ptiloglossa arizonensis]|uniref:uncharacterized protein LOC143150080 isoform X2 n=1 Tax=Ptiloglossa arizonensis TaxID=3350558 RepID=UPI003F9F38E2
MEVKGWRIGEDVFEKALQHQVPDETEINFFSDLFEATVKYTITSKNEKSQLNHSASLIIKVEPSNECSRAILRQQDLFLTELIVVRDVLPKIKEIIGRPIGPQLWYGCDNPPILIMENLLIRKFGMKCRRKGLPFEHCRLVMELLAKFHAGSVAIYEKNPGFIESFRDGGIVSTKCPAAFCRLMEVSLQRIGEAIQQWSDEKCISAAPKLIKLAETVGARCCGVYEYDSNEFCVLNHGDCWVNNLMFKENEKGQPVDLLMVDYQMAVYTSPVIDLLYFLNICPEYTVKYDNDDYFLEVYLNTLNETMANIGCRRKPLTMQQLKEAIHKRRIYAVFSGLILYLRMMANKEDAEHFTKILHKFAGETRLNVFKNPEAVKLAQKMIPVMDERGYFD